MSNLTLFHNPRCSKSRAALELLEARGWQAQIRLYLEQPPSVSELQTLLNQLGISARQLLRNSEAEYQELGLSNPALSEADLLAAMAAHPRLIERPILVHGDQAVIGRPTEKLLEILP